jgi:hypothetical protein
MYFVTAEDGEFVGIGQTLIEAYADLVNGNGGVELSRCCFYKATPIAVELREVAPTKPVQPAKAKK